MNSNHNILLIGDIHGHSSGLMRVQQVIDENLDPTSIVFLGDTLWKAERVFMTNLVGLKDSTGNPIPTYIIGGNHEDYDLFIDELGLPLYGTDPVETPWADHVFWMPRGSYLPNTPVKICTVGGATSIDRDSRTPGYTWWFKESIDMRQLRAVLPETAKADIVLTHDSPSYPALEAYLDATAGVVSSSWGQWPMKASQNHRLVMDEIVKTLEPMAVYHGHYHANLYSPPIRKEWGLCAYKGLLNIDSSDFDFRTVPSGSWHYLDL